MKHTPLLFIATLSILFASCGRTKEAACVSQQRMIEFVHYSAADLVAFTLMKFQPNDNFQHVIDSQSISAVNSTYDTHSDTTYVGGFNSMNAITADFDWKIILPATGQTFTITDIVSEHKTMEYTSSRFSMDKFIPYCENFIFSMKLNGVQVNSLLEDPSTHYVTLVK